MHITYEVFRDLAIVLMFGALASTLLTLVVVPLVCFMVERRTHPQPIPKAWEAAEVEPSDDGTVNKKGEPGIKDT